MSWPVVSVKDICQLRYGKALKASARSDAGYPVVGSGGVVGAHAEALIGGPSIVVGRKGSIGSLTYLEEPSWPIDTTYYVTESGTEADLRWLYWALQSLGLNGMNKSAAVPGLNREDVYRLALPLPPLPEQRRITSILDQADELRRSLGVRVAILEEMQTSVFLDLASRSDARSVPLSEIATTTSGGTPSREVNENYGQGHYWVKSGEVSQDVVLTTGETITDLGLSSSSAKLMPPGTVLLAMYGATAGEVGILGVQAATNQAVCCITPRQGVSAEYLVMALKAQRSTLKSMAVGGAQPNLSQGQIRTLHLPLMSTEDQVRVARATLSIRKLKRKAQSQADEANNLCSSIQVRAFAGEL